MTPPDSSHVSVLVQGTSLYEICKAIDEHLKYYQKLGWNISKGTVGLDNICRYNIYKESECLLVEFDVTSSLKYIGNDMLGFTIATLAMGMPQASIYLANLAVNEQKRKSKEWHDKYDIIIYWIVLGVLFTIVIFYYQPSGK
ncbi:MAG: hypothetical protein WCL71_09695 [Deltaproteobacteria bacterium]